jgi:hypothetical protein
MTVKYGVPKGRKYRMVRTSRGGINMPKKQPCPVCSSNCKRQDKTLGGANYRCSKHGSFFILKQGWNKIKVIDVG